MQQSPRALSPAFRCLPIACLLGVVVVSGFTCSPGAASMAPMQEPDFRAQRHRMVERQLAGRDIEDPRVLRAMRETPRHHFVPADQVSRAYEDRPLSIGESQTISQPYIVALMTQLLEPDESSRILEVGTGSGYQAAVLSGLVERVYSIEIVPVLAERATALFAELGYENIEVRQGDGYQGWPEEAPFDGIVVTAAPPEIPPPLLDQLAPGGRLVIPVGRTSATQTLLVVERTEKGLERRAVIPVRFVPMTGRAQDP